MGKNIEVYIDDMVVKSKILSEHIGDLTNIFKILKEHKLCLNASKCSFGVGSSKFLGYMVIHQGIEVNPDQIKVINNLQPPRNPKEVQKLTGMMTALNWFIFRSTDRCRPFFLLMSKWKGFEWTEECAQAFQQLKEYLSHPPIMSSLETDEVIFAYIAVASHAVSLVLIRVDSGRQRPVYYVSKSLHEAEIRYLPLETAIRAERDFWHYLRWIKKLEKKKSPRIRDLLIITSTIHLQNAIKYHNSRYQTYWSQVLQSILYKFID